MNINMKRDCISAPRQPLSRINPNSMQQRALAAGLSPQTVHARLKAGMSVEEALSTPPMPVSESASKAGKASRAKAQARKAEVMRDD